MPHPSLMPQTESFVLGHVEDRVSPSFWNTPFIVKVNLSNKAVDAALDTGASISAVRADMVSEVVKCLEKVQPWTAPPVQLANNTACSPTGIVWLNIGFQGQHFYHRFVVIPNLSSSLILGMDFMLRASVSIHIPSRTVTVGESSSQLYDEALPEWMEAPEAESLMFLDVCPSILEEKVDLACLQGGQKEQLLSLLKDFWSLFDGHLGHTSMAEHVINTGDAKPVHLPPYRTSPAKKQIIEEQIQLMLEQNIIEPSSSPWAAPVVIVKKPCGTPRFCVDYRGLNNLTLKDSYPLPRVDESLDFLSKGRYLTTLDLSRGYWQVSVDEHSRPKTAFVSHCGLFQFKVLPFGLCNAPATFQRVMNNVLAGLIYKCCAVYIDDIVIASPTFEQHLMDIKEVLSRLASAGLSLKLSKCQFCLNELVFLGYRVTPDGVSPDPKKVEAVTEFKTPKDVKQVRGFLGLTGYYRRFIPNYAQKAEPLFKLTRKETPFDWDDDCQIAMDFLKSCLTSEPILCFPDFTRPFFIHTDACDLGLGAALMQKDDMGRDVAVAFASRTLHKSERPYSTPEKECLGVIWAMEHFRPYVEGLHVTIYTDHNSLKWLMSRPNPSGRLARWSLRLQDFDFTIVHKPGVRNSVPDALSRNPLTHSVDPIDILPPHAVICGLDLRSLSSVMVTDKEQLRQMQKDDPVIGNLLQSLEEGDTNEEHVVHDGLLYFKDHKAACTLHPMKQLKLFVPTLMRHTVLQYYHDHPTAGHLGVTKTLARLRQRFFWPKMAADIKKYVVSCHVCQFTKPSQRKPAGLMIPIEPTKPWEYTGVDFVGPLPRTQNGNEYLIVFVDYFSKWVEVSAVRSATAQVAASKFLSEIYARHGAPVFLISDRGTPFVSNLFEHVVAALGTEHRLTTAYHPQTNATERVNRTLKTAIRAYVGDKHTSWDKYLPQICFALRTAHHESTGLSPAMMLYGRELETPLDLLTQPNSAGVDDPEIPYPESLRASLQDAHDHARAALSANHAKRKHYYDKRRRMVFYAVGDLVRVKTHPKSDADASFTAKLAPVYTGPFRVSKRLSDVNYRLTNVNTEEDVGVFHVVNLQPFHMWDTASPETGSHIDDVNALPWDGVCDSQDDRSVETHHVVGADQGNVNNCSDAMVPENCLPDSVTDTGDAVPFSAPSAQGPGHYVLRQRKVPRVTSDWSVHKWTNPFHTQRFEL